MSERFGKYILTKLIGAGGMAEVFLAEMVGPGGFAKQVALKRIHSSLLSNDEFFEAFVSEARLGGQLNHPNIVQTLELGQEEDRLFLSMEYVQGITLAQFMRYSVQTRQPVDLPVMLEIARQMTDGLAYAHSATDLRGAPLKMVHRDLKPENILISTHGVAKISDFGVSRAESNLSKTVVGTQIKGTVAYMSPEQAHSLDIDHRSDLFSLGAILFEMCCQEKLYPGVQGYQGITRVQNWEIQSRLPLLDDLPRALSELIKWLLARTPEERPASAEVVRQQLKPIISFYPLEVGQLVEAIQAAQAWILARRGATSLKANLNLAGDKAAPDTRGALTAPPQHTPVQHTPAATSGSISASQRLNSTPVSTSLSGARGESPRGESLFGHRQEGKDAQEEEREDTLNFSLFFPKSEVRSLLEKDGQPQNAPEAPATPVKPGRVLLSPPAPAPTPAPTPAPYPMIGVPAPAAMASARAAQTLPSEDDEDAYPSFLYSVRDQVEDALSSPLTGIMPVRPLESAAAQKPVDLTGFEAGGAESGHALPTGLPPHDAVTMEEEAENASWSQRTQRTEPLTSPPSPPPVPFSLHAFSSPDEASGEAVPELTPVLPPTEQDSDDEEDSIVRAFDGLDDGRDLEDDADDDDRLPFAADRDDDADMADFAMTQVRPGGYESAELDAYDGNRLDDDLGGIGGIYSSYPSSHADALEHLPLQDTSPQGRASGLEISDPQPGSFIAHLMEPQEAQSLVKSLDKKTHELAAPPRALQQPVAPQSRVTPDALDEGGLHALLDDDNGVEDARGTEDFQPVERTEFLSPEVLRALAHEAPGSSTIRLEPELSVLDFPDEEEEAAENATRVLNRYTERPQVPARSPGAFDLSAGARSPDRGASSAGFATVTPVRAAPPAVSAASTGAGHFPAQGTWSGTPGSLNGVPGPFQTGMPTPAPMPVVHRGGAVPTPSPGAHASGTFPAVSSGFPPAGAHPSRPAPPSGLAFPASPGGFSGSGQGMPSPVPSARQSVPGGHTPSVPGGATPGALGPGATVPGPRASGVSPMRQAPLPPYVPAYPSQNVTDPVFVRPPIKPPAKGINWFLLGMVLAVVLSVCCALYLLFGQ